MLDQISRCEKLVARMPLLVSTATQNPLRGRPPKIGLSAAAAHLGVSVTTVHRALRIASLCDEAKLFARERGMADSQRPLLAAGAEKDPVKQIEIMREMAAIADVTASFDRLMDAWNRATPEARARFYDYLMG